MKPSLSAMSILLEAVSKPGGRRPAEPVSVAYFILQGLALPNHSHEMRHRLHEGIDQIMPGIASDSFADRIGRWPSDSTKQSIDSTRVTG